MNASAALRLVARTLWRMPERLLHPFRHRTALGRVRGGPRPRAVLVVCHGNICRSPYAAALLEQELTRSAQHAIRVESAGFAGWGRPCPPIAAELAAAQGLDLSMHRSRAIAPDRVSVADLIVVMNGAQAWAVRRLFGRRERDVLILGDLDPEPIETREIQDPVEQPQEVYERCYARIHRCVRQLVQAWVDGAERTSARAPGSRSEPELTT